MNKIAIKSLCYTFATYEKLHLNDGRILEQEFYTKTKAKD